MGDEIVLLRGGRHVVTQCGVCGVVYTVPEIVYNHHRQEGGFHHCPTGHQWGWPKEKSERERLRLERDRLAQRIAEKDDEIAAERRMREEAERSTVAMKGQVTKLRKRASAGTCPCCKRTFQQLARHMAQKHPAFVAEEIPSAGIAKH